MQKTAESIHTHTHTPDLIVDSIQLLLQHEGECLGVGLSGRGQQVHRAEDGLAVVLQVGHVHVTLEGVRHVRQHVGLLHALPLLFIKRLDLTGTTRTKTDSVCAFT